MSTQESVFVTITREAMQHGALNLAQGVFDHGPPQAVLDALAAVGSGTEHQYSPSPGHPALRAAVADSVRVYDQCDVDQDAEITVTAGATEAIYCTLTALLIGGGEVVLLEPAYEQYRPVIARAGGTVRALPLPTTDDRLDIAALAAVCTPQTKAIVVNSPWNPLGRALDDAEWAAIARVATERGIVVVSDETYEHLMLDGGVHRGVLSAVVDPELRVKISSASKTFAVTGWRIGWAVAGPTLTRRIRAMHQFVTYCPAVPLQLAVADVLARPDFSAVRAQIVDGLRDRVDWFTATLCDLGLAARRPEAAFYVTADVGDDARDWCLRMMRDGGVAALPVAAFFQEHSAATASLVRFAVCKSMPLLADAGDRLRARVGQVISR